MKWVLDKSRRFGERPHYDPEELDGECEEIVGKFLQKRYGKIKFPVSTDDLSVLVEEVANLDLYADLSIEGKNVEGLTEFSLGKKPMIRISKEISENPVMINRFRTTLTHELGHAHFHRFLWEMKLATPDLFQGHSPKSPVCKRENLLNAPDYDWMEWQAGYACGAFLMPRKQVEKVVLDFFRQEGIQYEKLDLFNLISQKIIKKIADIFSVSNEASQIRLIKLGYIVPGVRNQTQLWH